MDSQKEGKMVMGISLILLLHTPSLLVDFT